MNMNIMHIGKDTTDRQKDSTEKQALLSESHLPCEIELTDADLEVIYGGGLVGGLPIVGGLLANLPIVGGGQGAGAAPAAGQ